MRTNEPTIFARNCKKKQPPGGGRKEVVISVPPEIIVAIVSLVGTVIGSAGGVLASSRLTNYRIAQLEKKVDIHNNFAGRVPIVEEQIKVINHRLEDLEDETK